MLAVIIPTINAETCLPSLLPSLGNTRVVVSDGGSTDMTLAQAIEVGAVIARGRPGRGAQLARGADLAGAADAVNAYLFLHADCRLPDGWQAAVETALRKPETAWYFRYGPEGNGRGVTWLRFIVWLRGWAWKLPYGDQGLLIPRAMYDQIGGFDKDKPLFEDVDITDRIKAKFGRRALQKLPILLYTDISDHLRQGIWKRGWRNYQLLKAYRRGAPVADLLRRYI